MRQNIARGLERACLKEIGSKMKSKCVKKWVAGRGNFGASDNLLRGIRFRRSGRLHECVAYGLSQVRGIACIDLIGHKLARHCHEMTVAKLLLFRKCC